MSTSSKKRREIVDKNREKVLLLQNLDISKRIESFIVDFDESAILSPDSAKNKLIKVKIQRGSSNAQNIRFFPSKLDFDQMTFLNFFLRWKKLTFLRFNFLKKKYILEILFISIEIECFSKNGKLIYFFLVEEIYSHTV